ncbi:MAG: undecaprenyldiphospho-muramoylpentapeptide beta-N-acetylglucosaminyltransferase [Flammeovirgaceae bacterium]|jgi:UDP-N-acetylglucosamine--N-acetylmuramyl-(pentapeptide) pyrophosphoryl-undecaprenol N-acetylglucosamine transferase|nr:undecaprenyldiphospho-muramoylpentapeptide beta-N-acetylglucosaminyltransferase [Flammeovirgaceae bacterium]|tara:strand:- start:12770 stop:13909 length:1140 start_codon:yes stop_codon:yes gene_type:complete
MKENQVMHKPKKIILCGGGTGGHIFPMIAIAEEFKKVNSENKILFVGSNDRMEMKIIPKYDFPIYGLWISGIKRSSLILNILFLGIPFILKNITLPFKILFSVIKSIYILIKFRPDFVIGFGGYSSGPFLLTSHFLNFKTAIQEQNSYPGLTNKMLSKKVKYIFTAYDKINNFFSTNTVFNFGNPIRNLKIKSNENAHKYFGLDSSKKTILVLGGSLGAKNINEGVLNNISLIRESSYQVIWQTGKFYYKNILSKNIKDKKIIIKDFINRMDLAYSVSDIIISRAGAIAISELCVISKPLILVPSPNVVDDHQTKNAKAISEKGGCVLIKDSDAKNTMLKTAFDLFENKSKMDSMKKSLSKLSSPNATQKIVNKIYEII